MDPLQTATAASTAQQTGDAAGGSDTADASAAATTDFETFLTLLTAQMRNQDPLQPMDSTEFVSQLASFSAVEQQIESNVRLDALIDAVAGGSGAGLAQWIGKEVQTAAVAPFDGAPMELATSPMPGAAAAALVVRDAGGAVVGRVPVDPAAEAFTWTGELGDRVADPGAYRFEVEYSDGESTFETREVRTFARVTEVRLSGASPSLVLEGGATVSSDDVSSIRDGSAESRTAEAGSEA
ncbi:MAG: flagellar hook capping FlgD N-terminal domain-containing protein [Pseudomonadota bacterium]